MGIKTALAVACLLSFASVEAEAKASAQPKSAPAKGENSCLVKQYTSEYLTREHEAAKAKAGIPFYMQTSSYLTFKVMKSGTVLVAMSETTYPGGTVYLMIDGKRYSSRSNTWIQLDAPALAALKQDKLIDFTYPHWPDRNEISRKDIFSGFTAAYDECLMFLGGKPKPPNPFPAPIGASNTAPKN